MSLILLLFFFLLFLQLTTSNFTATFFFGDSTLDTGNNKFMPTPMQGNHVPYGLDFQRRTPTGRFSNGLLVPDLLTSSLNIKKLSPPYLDPNLSDFDIWTGVNFASAGSGYDEVTSELSDTVPVSGQLKMFEEYLGRLKGIVGEEESKRIVGGALVLFSAGGNDVIFNFYDLPRRKAEFDMSGYQDFLHRKMADAVKSVYKNGARKFIVAGLPPIGCLPIQITAALNNEQDRKCVGDQMLDTVAYNSKLKNLLPKLQHSLPGARIAYLDITDQVIEIMSNPKKFGFEETNKGCCGTGLVETGPLCNQFSKVCKNVDSFMFFDAIHPSQRLYKLVTDHIMDTVIVELQ